LKDVLKKLERISKRKQTADPTESMAQALVSYFKFPASFQAQYVQRLRYGLQYYYARHYNANGSPLQAEG